jgi:Peptidase family M49
MFARTRLPLALVTLLSLSATAGPGCSSAVWEPPVIPAETMVTPPNDKTKTSDADAAFFDDDDDDDVAGHGTASLAQKITQFAPATIQADLSKLPASEKAALDAIIEASKLLDQIFDRQAYAKNPALGAKLRADTSAEGKHKLAYWTIMRGPWDRQDHHRPFATSLARPPGAGFYPEDLTATELDAYLKKHPADEKAVLGLFTVVERKGDRLVGVPYSKYYAQWLKPASAKLRQAAKLTKDRTLKKFLTSRAAAFLSDDYYQSDKDWMDLNSQVEVTIGPYEVYEDGLKAAKAAFESFVTVTDPAASKKLAKYKNLLVAMEQHLPVPKNVKTKRGRESPIRVVDLVFSSGDARKSVQTIAFNLPNDERVRKEKGAKKVLLRNVIQTKFDVILKPIASRIMAADQQKHLSADAFFNQVLFHELSHSLGPAMTTKNGKQVEVRQALENTYSAIEECKADVMGAYNILYMIERKEFPASFRQQLLVSYFAGLFRSVRFGVAEAHGKGAAIQINRFLEAGGATFSNGRFTVNSVKLEKAITALVKDLVMLQHEGSKAKAKAMLDTYGVMSGPMKEALSKVADVPVDLRPRYPAAGE